MSFSKLHHAMIILKTTWAGSPNDISWVPCLELITQHTPPAETWAHLIPKKVLRGFETRSLDSEFRMLIVTHRTN